MALFIVRSDPEPPVQQQALGFVRNLVDGSIDSIGFIFTEDAIILHAVGRQLRRTSKDEVCVQVRTQNPVYCICDLMISKMFLLLSAWLISQKMFDVKLQRVYCLLVR